MGIMLYSKALDESQPNGLELCAPEKKPEDPDGEDPVPDSPQALTQHKFA